MIFKNNTGLDSLTNCRTVYLCDYIPRNRSKDYIDSRSDELVLSFKDQKRNSHALALEIVSKYLRANLDRNIALVAVPPSKKERNFKTACHELIHKIIAEIGEENNLIDASDCLFRKEDMEAQHLSGGKRSSEILLKSTGLQYPEKFLNMDVLVIDDITTSGNSFKVADTLLLQNGAKHVLNFAVGKTIQNKNLKIGFILDLDGTLFDTDIGDIKKKRSLRKWDEARELASSLEPLDGVRVFFEKYSKYDYRIVTSSPASYAFVLTNKLTIPNSKVIAYHDTKRHKPEIDPYMEAKRQMQIYEPCIIVVGNEESDITPAKHLGMTSVLLSNQTNSDADFTFANFAEFMKELDNVILNAEKKFSFLLPH